MDKSTIANAAERARRRQSADTRRIWVYTFLIVVLGTVIFTQPGGDDRPADAERPYEYPDEPVIREVLADPDPQILAGVRDTSRVERSTLESEPFRHLLIEAGKLVYGDLEQLGIEQGSWDELTSAPAEHRGEPYWVLGELQWVELMQDDGPTHWRGEVVDEEGLSWHFAVVVQPNDIVPGDVVRVQGFFLKHYEGLRPDRSFASGPMLVGEELVESAWRIEPVTSLPSTELEELRDYDLEAATRPLEEPLFYEMLSYVSNTDVDSFFPPDASMEDYEIEPVTLMQNSSLYRGKPVRVYGRLLYKEQMPLGPRGENPLGEPFAWFVWIDNQWGGMSVAISFDEPEGMQKGDIIHADGLYYRRWAFENAVNRPVMTAAVITKRFVEHVPKPDELTPMLRTGILVLAGVIAVLLLIGSIGDRRAASDTRKRRMRLHRKNVARPGRLTKERTEPAPSSDVPTGGDVAPEGPA